MAPGEARQKPQYLFPDGVRFGNDKLVLHARARRHVVRHFPGPLSIKTVLDGRVDWIVNGRRLVVDEHSFLGLHDGKKSAVVPRLCDHFLDMVVDSSADPSTRWRRLVRF